MNATYDDVISSASHQIAGVQSKQTGRTENQLSHFHPLDEAFSEGSGR